jgi:hypothetical protein
MSDWLSDVIASELITIYEDHYFTEDALLWLRERPRTFGELRTEEIDWLRWMAPTPATRMYWQSCHRIRIAMSACGWRVTR